MRPMNLWPHTIRSWNASWTAGVRAVGRPSRLRPGRAQPGDHPARVDQADPGAGTRAGRHVVQSWPARRTLTELGATLLPQARELVAAADEFTAGPNRLAHGEAGRLTVGFGCPPSTSPTRGRRVPAVVSEVEISLEDLPSSVQVDRIRTGGLHAGFIRLPWETTFTNACSP